MKIYFLSDKVCALRLGGLYFGQVDNFERFAQINLSDRVFVEFIPENALPITFFLTDEILHVPPRGCDVYILRDALILHARTFPPTDFSLRVITQAQTENCTATLFIQGEVSLSIQTDKNFFVATLPPSFCDAKLFFEQDFLFVKNENQLAIFNKYGKRLFMEKVLSYTFQDSVLSVSLPLQESLGRTAECQYALTETECKRINCELSAPRGEIPAEWFAFAFFESLLIGATSSEFLCDDMQSKLHEIRAFLGDFTAILPTEEKNCCILFYQKQEGLFEGKYFTLSIKDGKIVDITT